MLLIGADVSMSTMGRSCDILFATKEGSQLKVVGKWGKGEIYQNYLRRHTAFFGSDAHSRHVSRFRFLCEERGERSLGHFELTELARLATKIKAHVG